MADPIPCAVPVAVAGARTIGRLEVDRVVGLKLAVT
jgi:hypothetical protein